MLNAARLRSLLDYDKATGIFRWLVVPNGRVALGAIAGSTKDDGYRAIKINGRSYGAHRLAWLHVTGEWPDDEIDHENRNRADNRWSNLRPATRLQNSHNCTVRRDSISGLKGVSKNRNRWVASIQSNKKRVTLGYFGTAEEAHAAYCRALDVHGDFARAA